MAITYVYSGPTTTIAGDNGTITVSEGQYMFLAGKSNGSGNTYWHTYDKATKKTWTWNIITMPEFDRVSRYEIGGKGGYVQHISRLNSSKYGSHNYHTASGGNMYTLRKPTVMYHDGGTRHPVTLAAGDVVIIGGVNPHGNTRDGDTFIRFWGYRKGGRSGPETELSGYWCETGVPTYPAAYVINTV